MAGFAEFVGNNWLNLIFGSATLASLYIAYSQMRKNRRSEKTYEYILKLANQNLDHSITEQTIAERKQEARRVADELHNLQRQIREDIPKEARRAALLDRHDAQVAQLKDAYESLKKTGADLANLGEDTSVPPDILRAIEAEISPDYLRREREAQYRTYITILTTVAAIAAATFGRFAGLVFLVAAVPFLVLLARDVVMRRRASGEAFAKIFLAWIMVGAGLCLVAMGMAVALLFGILSSESYSGGESRTFTILAIVGGAILIIGVIVTGFGFTRLGLIPRRRRERCLSRQRVALAHAVPVAS